MIHRKRCLNQRLTGLKKNQLLGEEELIRYQDEYGEESFTAGIGAEAILEILKSIDLEKEKNFLKELGSLDPLVIELNAKNRYTKNATK